MNRFAKIGETADPCGVPLSRSTMVPSGYCSGARSHRLTYSSTHRSVVTASTALTIRSHGTVSKNFATSRSMTQSFCQHRRRHAPTACSCDLFGRYPYESGVEPRLHQRLQEHRRYRLGYPITDRGHAERPDPSAMRLRDFHRPYRWRKIRSRAHPVPDPVQLVLQIRLEFRQGLLVHPRGTFVLRDLLVCLPHHGLGNIERLDLRLRHVPSSPPGT